MTRSVTKFAPDSRQLAPSIFSRLFFSFSFFFTLLFFLSYAHGSPSNSSNPAASMMLSQAVIPDASFFSPQTMGTRIGSAFMPTNPEYLNSNAPFMIGAQNFSYSAGNPFVVRFLQPNLEVGYRYRYIFNGRVDAVGLGHRHPVTIPDGWYKLTVAVLKQNTDHIYGRKSTQLDRFITAAPPMFTYVSGQQFHSQVDLVFSSIEDAATTNLLYIELYPLSENCQNSGAKGAIRNRSCLVLGNNHYPDPARSQVVIKPGFQPYLFEMNFLAYRPSDGANTDPGKYLREGNPFAPETLAGFVTRALAYQAAARAQRRQLSISPKQYAQSMHLNYIDINDPRLDLAERFMPSAVNFRSAIQRLLATKRLGTIRTEPAFAQVIPGFCALLEARNGSLRDGFINDFIRSASQGFRAAILSCQQNPEARFALSRVIHIGSKVGGEQDTQVMPVRKLDLSVTKNFVVSRTHTASSVWSFSMRPLVGFTRAMDSVTTLWPFDLSHATNTATENTRAELMGASTSDHLLLETMGFNIPTARSLACVQFTTLPSRGSPFYDSRPDALNGLYICESEPHDMEIQEIYGHLTTRAPDSASGPGTDPASLTINQAFRGDAQLSLYFYLLRNYLKPEHEAELFPDEFPKGAVAGLRARPPQLPNIVEESVHIGEEPSPSLTENYFNQAVAPYTEDHAPGTPPKANSGSAPRFWYGLPSGR